MTDQTKTIIAMTNEQFLGANPKNVSSCRMIRVSNGPHKEYALQPYQAPGLAGGPSAVGGFDYSYVLDKAQLIQLAHSILEEFSEETDPVLNGLRRIECKIASLS